MLTQSSPEASRSRVECRQSSRSSSPSSCDAPDGECSVSVLQPPIVPISPLQPQPQTLASPLPDNYASLVTLLQVLADKGYETNAAPPLPTATTAEGTTGQGTQAPDRRHEWRRSKSVPWDTRTSVMPGGRESIDAEHNIADIDINIDNDNNDSGGGADASCDVDLLQSSNRSRLMRSKSWEGRPPLTAAIKARWESVRLSQRCTSPRMMAADQQQEEDQGKPRPRSKLVLSESRNPSWAPEVRLPDEAEREEKQRAHRPTVSDVGGNEAGMEQTAERQRALDVAQVLVVEMQREIKSRWTIHYSELELLGKVGMGDFGIVYLAKWRNSKVVVKQLFHKQKLTSPELNDFKREMDIIMNLRPHHNLIQFFGMCDEPPNLCIVTEYLAQGDLQRLMQRELLSPATKLRLALGVAAGMTHLHAENILHCDLAARNILVTTSNGEYQAKVTDFGLSKRVKSGVVRHSFSHSQAYGPIKWMSPEALHQTRLSKQSDVYSFGVVLWELLTEKAPYENMDAVEAGQAIVEGKKLEVPPWAPPDYAALLHDCWLTDPALRPSFNDIYSRIEEMSLNNVKWDSSGRRSVAPASLTTRSPVVIRYKSGLLSPETHKKYQHG